MGFKRSLRSMLDRTSVTLYRGSAGTAVDAQDIAIVPTARPRERVDPQSGEPVNVDYRLVGDEDADFQHGDRVQIAGDWYRIVYVEPVAQSSLRIAEAVVMT